MLRRSLFLGLGAWALSSYSFGQDLSTRIFSPTSPPSGCQAVAGLFPAGDRTALIWNYEKYAVVMPPYKKKVAQSFQCGGQKGTLYFFDYATEAEKDHALLFAKPVLAKQHGVAHELPIREWSTGFVLVSFVDAPPELLAALTERLMGKTPAPPPVAVAMKSTHEAWTPVANSEPPAPKTVKPFVSPVSSPTPQGEPFAQLKPSIADQPFESTDRSKSIQAVKVQEPPKHVVKQSPPPAPLSAPAPAPIPVVKPAKIVRAIPKPVPVFTKAAAAPPVGTADLSSSVLESYASKMGCESSERNLQTKMVCGFMQEFASGLPPELPFKSDTVLVGPVYTVDANGRFTDLHYNVLAGSYDPDVVSFFSLPSTGGKDDFEIKQLVEARKAKASLPTNDTTARLPALIAAKRFGLRKSTGRSAVIQPSPDHRLFIRRAGDHWIVIGVSGNTSDAQLNTALTVIVLY